MMVFYMDFYNQFNYYNFAIMVKKEEEMYDTFITNARTYRFYPFPWH